MTEVLFPSLDWLAHNDTHEYSSNTTVSFLTKHRCRHMCCLVHLTRIWLCRCTGGYPLPQPGKYIYPLQALYLSVRGDNNDTASNLIYVGWTKPRLPWRPKAIFCRSSTVCVPTGYQIRIALLWHFYFTTANPYSYKYKLIWCIV